MLEVTYVISARVYTGGCDTRHGDDAEVFMNDVSPTFAGLTREAEGVVPMCRSSCRADRITPRTSNA